MVAILFAALAGVWAPVQSGPQLVFGNPSNGVSDMSTPDNYFLVHQGFIMSYNRSRGAPNGVTWHISASDIGDVERTNAFRADASPPVGWRVSKADYNGSG